MLQTSILCMKWDPTGHMLMTCATGDSHVKVWMPGREGLTLLHDLCHNSAVTYIQWCPLLGKGENKLLLLARLEWSMQSVEICDRVLNVVQYFLLIVQIF